MKSHGVRADHIGDRGLLALRHAFEIDRARVARRDHVDAGGARPAQHDAAAADIGMAAVAELHDVEARRDIRRAVLAVLQMHRQRAEIRLLALADHLLHRRVRAETLIGLCGPASRLVISGRRPASSVSSARASRLREPITLPISSAFSGPTALNQVAFGLPSSTAPTSTRSIGVSWISHSPSCTSRSTKRRRRKRSVSAAAIGLSSCIARLVRACRLLPTIGGEQCHAGDGNETQGPRRDRADAARRIRPAAPVPSWRQRPSGVAAGVRPAVQELRGVRARTSGLRHLRQSAVDAQHRRSRDVLPRFHRRA